MPANDSTPALVNKLSLLLVILLLQQMASEDILLTVQLSLNCLYPQYCRRFWLVSAAVIFLNLSQH